MTEEPDFIQQSGREDLPLLDRVNLLKADLIDLQQHHRPTGADTHGFNSMLAAIQACIRDGQKMIDEPDYAPKTSWGSPFALWGIVNLSRVECRVLAWRRGGAQEHQRVMALAYPRHKPVARETGRH